MDPKHKDVKSVAEADEIEALFVQTAHAMSYDDGKLTLHTLAPTTLFFSDRPDRVTGHISSEEFVDSWDKGPATSLSACESIASRETRLAITRRQDRWNHHP